MDFDKTINRKHTNSIKWDKYTDSDVLGLGTADMDFLSSEYIVKALTKKAEKGIYGYELKSKSYYKSIIEWNSRNYNWEIQKDWISNSPGIWAGIRICVDTFSAIGDKILVQSPTFHPIVEIVKQTNRQLITSELKLVEKRYEIDFEEFENKLKQNVKIFILVNPQNPTGRALTVEELTKIGNLCLKYGVIVISDEVYGPLTYEDNCHIPFSAISNDISQNSIVFNAVSKPFNLQGLTHAILIIPNSTLFEQYNNSLKGYDFDFATNIFSLTAVEAAYTYGDEWLKEVKDYLQSNLDYLVEFFESKLTMLKVIRPESMFMAWIDCGEIFRDYESLEELFLSKAKIAPTFGKVFGNKYERFIRLNFGCSLETLKEALNRLYFAMNSIG
jgi:cystathionine beta-lyase